MEGQRKVTPMVLWRCVWLIPYLAITILQMAVTLIGFGYGSAKAVWENKFEALV